ncbi:DoxX family membrane protein [Hymenobacter sp. BT18]|uniref:DoxX family protein n=1 Tax=Hymenobacter sp. BT18 TaxID=2835648 RepID=UPI00143E544B|nr:DoxX family membrane protein [Hymenobacter sp. BT18]QIX61247.1 DoxX family membrane protein [Hymenobacter sp. BT18]
MASHPHTTTLQNVARALMGTFMVAAGTGHLTFQRREFQAQVPDFVPLSKDTTVLASGVVEIGLGLALLLAKGRNRQLMGIGLAAFYAAVFPGNIHQYTHHLSAFGLDTDEKRLGRLFLQPVLMGWALWSTGALSLSSRAKATRPTSSRRP